MSEHNQERKARREQELKEREQKEQEQKERDSLLEALQNQYKIFRDEVRFFATSAATSTTLLALLLFGELTAARAKDNPDPRLYLLIPLSVIWYGGVLAVFLSHLQVAAKYSELLEVWMNTLLGDDFFQFEARYTFPRENSGRDIGWFVVLVTMVGILPAGCALWAGYVGLTKGFHFSVVSAWIFLGLMFSAFIVELIAVAKVRQRRENQNIELLTKWQGKYLPMNCQTPDQHSP